MLQWGWCLKVAIESEEGQPRPGARYLKKIWQNWKTTGIMPNKLRNVLKARRLKRNRRKVFVLQACIVDK